jgi:hypothetical protein
MRFLTLEVYKSGDTRAAFARYTQYLEGLRGVLPDHVLELARLPGVDDGLVVEVHHAVSAQVLLLVLRCGDLQMGYYDLVLTYEDATISPGDEWTLAKIARTTKGAWHHSFDLYYHEVDSAGEDRIEHRMFFHPGVWFGIRCRELRWTKRPRPDRELPSLADRFPGGPPGPPGSSGRVRRRRVRAEPVRR